MSIDVNHCYRRYGAMVYRRCFALLRDEQLAEDVMQDVFVKLCTHHERLDDQGLSSLLYRVATRESLNALRSKKRRRDQPTEALLEHIASVADEEGRTVARQLLTRLFGVESPLAHGTARFEQASSQEIAVLHLYDGLTLEQVARHTGMSVSGVRKRLRGITAKLEQLAEVQP